MRQHAIAIPAIFIILFCLPAFAWNPVRGDFSWDGKVSKQPLRLPGSAGSSGSASYLSVMTHEDWEFRLVNTTDGTVQYSINGKSHNLRSGHERKHAFPKARGTNSGNIKSYAKPSIHFSGYSKSVGEHEKYYFVRQGKRRYLLSPKDYRSYQQAGRGRELADERRRDQAKRRAAQSRAREDQRRMQARIARKNKLAEEAMERNFKDIDRLLNERSRAIKERSRLDAERAAQQSELRIRNLSQASQRAKARADSIRQEINAVEADLDRAIQGAAAEPKADPLASMRARRSQILNPR